MRGANLHPNLHRTMNASNATLNATSCVAPTAAAPFVNEAKVLLLATALVLFSVLFERCFRTSPLLGQIVAGLVLGPALLDWVPFPTAAALLGKVGVMLLVVESGLSVDVGGLRKVGCRALAAAVLGVALPVGLTLLVLMYGWSVEFKGALAAGAAIAPTSLGFSASLLGPDIATSLGQMICGAAVIDDGTNNRVCWEVFSWRLHSPRCGHGRPFARLSMLRPTAVPLGPAPRT